MADTEDTERLTRDQALGRLREIGETGAGDPETAHQLADSVLLLFIDDQEIASAWGDIPKWWA